jgi:hypothetical protein
MDPEWEQFVEEPEFQQISKKKNKKGTVSYAPVNFKNISPMVASENLALEGENNFFQNWRLSMVDFSLESRILSHFSSKSTSKTSLSLIQFDFCCVVVDAKKSVRFSVK